MKRLLEHVMMISLFSNQPSQEADLTLADITDLLRADLGGGQTPGKAIVQRSNSSPSIGGGEPGGQH